MCCLIVIYLYIFISVVCFCVCTTEYIKQFHDMVKNWARLKSAKMKYLKTFPAGAKKEDNKKLYRRQNHAKVI